MSQVIFACGYDEAILGLAGEKVIYDIFHCGKVPRNTKDQVKEAQRIVRLRKTLNDAIEGENYEEGARIRDELKQLESEMS